jgi:hypothetical protein
MSNAPANILAAGGDISDEARGAAQDALRAQRQAESVREESFARARDQAEKAGLKAAEETRRGRIEALGSIHLDSFPSDPKDAATASARAAAELAEIQALRRARRAREEAFAKAQAETDKAEQVAAAKAERAASLVASGVADPAPRQPEARKPEAPAPVPPRPAGGAPSPAPVPPQRPAPKMPVIEEAPPQEPARGDEIGCPTCSQANPPARHFCSSCGTVLRPAPPPVIPNWWERFLASLQNRPVRSYPEARNDPSRRSGGPDLARAKSLAGRAKSLKSSPSGGFSAGTRPGSGMGMGSITRLALAAGVGLFLVLVVGPLRPQVTNEFHRIRANMAPQPAYINGQEAVQATSKSVRIPNLTDLDPSTVWKLSDLSTPGSAGARPAFSVLVDGHAPTATMNLDAVGVVPGHPGQHATLALPAHMTVVAVGADSKVLKTAEFSLAQVAKFQPFHFRVDGVNHVDVYFPDVYAVTGAQPGYLIDEIELFSRT